MSDKNFEIGQVVYILSEQAQTILPGMVVEECVVKKLSGNSISWKVKVGAGEKAKLFDSAKIKGEVYGSLEEVRTVMTQRLTDFVNNLTKEAEQRVEKWYGKEIAERQKTLEPLSVSNDPDDKIDPDLLLSSLENTAPTPKFHSPAPSTPSYPSQVTNKDLAKERLRALATPPEEELAQNGAVFVLDDKGNRIPVKLPPNLS